MENIENFDDGVTHVAPPGEFKPMEITGRPCGRCRKLTPLKDFIVGFHTSNHCPKCRKKIANDAIKRRAEQIKERKARFGY